jgi:hypothetical protein
MPRHGLPLSPFSRLASRMVLAVLIVWSFAGCARLTAGHLTLEPWAGEGSRELSEKFMHFAFQTSQNANCYEVKGAAFPNPENLPSWADSVDNLTLMAYLCDEHGNVLAHDARVYPPQKITTTGFPFDLILRYDKDQPPGGCYVAFGYRGMFTASRPPASGGQGGGGLSGHYAFFASEQATRTR